MNTKNKKFPSKYHSNNQIDIEKVLYRKRNPSTLRWLGMCCISNFHVHTRVPFIKWIKKYKFSDFPSDLIAGIIICIVIQLQAIAIAMVINVSSEYGLYSSIFGGFVNFIFGTSKDVSMGPTILAAVVCSRYNPNGSFAVLSIIAFFNGLVFLLLSFINFGFVMEYISYSVLKGWITSGALTICISQLPSWLGIKIENSSSMSSYELFYAVFSNIKQKKDGDLCIGIACFILYGILHFCSPHLKRLKERSKNATTSRCFSLLSYLLIAKIGWIIALASLFAYLFFSSSPDLVTFLEAPKPGFPIPYNPFSNSVENETRTVIQIIGDVYPSFFLAPIVVLIETLAGARNFAKQFGYQVDNNQELMCLGLANLINSFFRGFPIGGALARTSVNALSGWLITSLLMIPALYCTQLIQYISKASLGACICAAALTQVQVMSFIDLWRISKLELLPWLVTCFVGLYRLEIGMVAGFIVSASFIMFRELRPRMHLECDDIKKTVTLFVKGAIHFPGAYSLATRIRTIKNYHPDVKKLVIDCTNMYETDTSVIEELKEAIMAIEKSDIDVTLKHLKKDRVYNLAIDAGLRRYVVRGLRTNSCVVDFHHHRFHLVPYHSNPRDMFLQPQELSEALFSESESEVMENDTNYLYTVRSRILH